MTLSFFPEDLMILPAVAAARGLCRAADGLLLQMMQETHKPSIDVLSSMEITVRQEIRAAMTAISEMTPSTREEAYARTDFLMERALAEGRIYPEVREMLQEGERHAASLPEDRDVS